MACFSIIAIGLNLLLGNTGQVSIGQAAFYGIGAYTSAILVVKVGLSFWLALPCAGIIAGLVGYFLGFTSVRFKGSYLAMATLSFGVIFSIIVLEWTGLTGGAGGYPRLYPARDRIVQDRYGIQIFLSGLGLRARYFHLHAKPGPLPCGQSLIRDQ